MPEVEKYKLGGSELSGPQGINPEWFVQRINELEQENKTLKNRINKLENPIRPPTASEICEEPICLNCGGCDEY